MMYASTVELTEKFTKTKSVDFINLLVNGIEHRADGNEWYDFKTASKLILHSWVDGKWKENK